MAGFEPSRLRVLVVDDLHERRVATRDVLAQIGVGAIRLAADPAEALVALRGQQIDALVLDDAFAPGAVQFIRALRWKTRGTVQATPIILLAAADGEKIRAARDAGVHEVTAKPPMPEMLRLRLEEIVLRPRPFIRSAVYVGPCRRRRRNFVWVERDRRGADGATGDASAEMATQASGD